MPIDKPTGEEVYKFRKKNPTLFWSEISKHYGLSVDTIQKREQRYRHKNNIPPIGKPKKEKKEKIKEVPKHKVKFVEDGYKANAYSISNRIRSLDHLLEVCNADLSKWKVSRHIVNVWESGRKRKVVDITWNEGVMDGHVEDFGDWQLTDLWQVKAWFEPRNEEPYEKALIDLIDRVKKYAPKYNRSSFSYKPLTSGYLLVPNLYDAHFGKRSHRNFNYTLEQAHDDFIKIAESISVQVSESNKKPEKILFPVGHDLLHVDSLLDQTSRGNWREMSVDVRVAIDAGWDATLKAVEAFATVCPIDIVPVEGNHDRLQTYYLMKFLKAFFSSHPYVNVYDMKLERQYYQWGKVGIGLTHDGKKPQDLATLFPIEAREMWGSIKWTEWLTGHFHHERGALYAVDSVRGTVVRTIPALCNMDNYHSLHMYVGSNRAAEVLYYHKEDGPAGSFPVFVSEL